MNIKVKRLSLLKALEEEKTRRIHEYAMARQLYPKQLEQARAQAVEAFNEMARLGTRARSGNALADLLEQYSNRRRFTRIDIPKEPKKPDLCQLNEYITLLKLATDDILSIGTESAWLRELAAKCRN